MNITIKNSGTFLFLVSAIYIITAFFSVGYHQLDEHYQILEFANYKLGLTYPGYLAWEFDAHIRPSLQPLIAAGIIKVLVFFNLSNPHIWALVLRLISGLLSIITIKHFVNSFLPEISIKLARYFIIASYLLWYLPYVNVRYSSENWSGLLFLSAVTLIRSEKFEHKRLQFILIGVCMGCSVLLKYQAALLIVGAIAWLIYIKRIKTRHFLLIILTISVVLILGFLLDSWFYGEWIVTIFNYFKVNILQGTASDFGVSPWYQYFIYILVEPIFPIGVLILASFLTLLYTDSKNLILWCILPFLVIHSLIPHKEVRFLFQIVNFTPLILILFIQRFRKIQNRKHYVFVKIVFGILFCINSIALILNSTKGAGDGHLVIAQYIHNHFINQPVNVISSCSSAPYGCANARDIFYSDKNVNVFYIKSIFQPDILTYKKRGYLNFIVLSDKEIAQPRVTEILKKLNVFKITESTAPLNKLVISFYNKALLDDNITLFELR